MQVLFENHGKEIVSRDNFEWNKSEFSKKFRHTTNAIQFVKKFQELTIFDRVHSIALTADGNVSEAYQTSRDQDEHFSSGANDSLEGTEARAAKRPSPTEEDTQHPPTKKPKKTDTCQIANNVESKKVGKLARSLDRGL